MASKYLASDVLSTVLTNEILSHWYLLWPKACLLRLPSEKVHLSCHSLSSLKPDLWKYAVTNLCAYDSLQTLYTTEQTSQSEIEFSWRRTWMDSCRFILTRKTVQIGQWINMTSSAFTVYYCTHLLKKCDVIQKNFLTESLFSIKICQKTTFHLKINFEPPFLCQVSACVHFTSLRILRAKSSVRVFSQNGNGQTSFLLTWP